MITATLDYVKMQWLMLQQETPEDFVIASGIQYSVREFIELSAKKSALLHIPACQEKFT